MILKYCQNLEVNYKALLEECHGVYDMYGLQHQLMEVRRYCHSLNFHVEINQSQFPE